MAAAVPMTMIDEECGNQRRHKRQPARDRRAWQRAHQHQTNKTEALPHQDGDADAKRDGRRTDGGQTVFCPPRTDEPASDDHQEHANELPSRERFLA